MKLTVIIMLAAFLQVSASSYAQRVTLKQTNAPLEQVLKEIKKQTGYKLFYNNNMLKKAVPVVVDLNNVALDDALKQVFKNQPLTYSVEDKTIIVKQKEEPSIEKIKAALAIPLTISGKVTDTLGTPLIGATVADKKSIQTAITNDNGEFTINAQIGDILTITYIGYKQFEFTVTSETTYLDVTLHPGTNGLNEVVVSTGYQTLPKERATGSFSQVNNALLNRSVSTDIISRLDGVTSGLILNKNLNSNLSILNQSQITVRGRSTLYANPSPLIVVDNFPYSGDINNINPNDIESVTILKDAAAASIWGVRSGNGVIVITTKKGKYAQPAKVLFNTNVTIGDKPNLWYTPRLSSSDYIDVEQFLFNKGFYNNTIANGHSSISPGVAILEEQKQGQLSAADATSQLDALRNQDVRNDLDKYLYRRSVSQQYFVNISGGGNNDQYYYSAGYDKNLLNLVGNDYNRLALNLRNVYALLDKKLEISTGVSFTRSNSDNNNSGAIPSAIPYLKLADAKGNPLPIPSPTLRQSYVDTAGSGKLLDWNYRPLDEIHLADNTIKLTDYQLTLGIKYKMTTDLSAVLNYQYSNGTSDNQNLQSQQTFYTRNLINEYTQINSSGITYPIPLGGIVDQNNNNYESNNLRGLLNYNHNWKSGNSFTGIAGFEYQNLNTNFSSNRLYGYNKDLDVNIPVDFVNLYPIYYLPFSQQIPGNPQANFTTTDHQISWFSNIAYNYSQRYIFSLSGREDKSNLFGVNTNQKGVPLWSAGFAWNVNSEKFYHIDWLPQLKLRITEGFTGNIDKNISAYTTASIQNTNTMITMRSMEQSLILQIHRYDGKGTG